MDLDMPVLDGLSAAKAIKAMPGPAPVIVALTAAAFIDDRERILASGCDDLLHKPYQEEELFLLIESRLNIRFVWRGSNESATKSLPDFDLSAALAALGLVTALVSGCALDAGDRNRPSHRPASFR